MGWSGNGKGLEDRAAFWREHLGTREESGLSVRVYCREHGLGEGSFYHWRRRFGLEGADLLPGRPADARSPFAQVRLTVLDGGTGGHFGFHHHERGDSSLGRRTHPNATTTVEERGG